MTVVPTSTSTVRVRYAETDKMGVVYYANYFVWFEVGRTDLLRTLGWSYREMEQAGVSLPVIEAHCEYRRRPATTTSWRSDRRPAAVARPDGVHLRSDARRPVDLAATGRTVHAASTRTDGRAGCRSACGRPFA